MGGLEGEGGGKEEGVLKPDMFFVFCLVSWGEGGMKGRSLPRFWRGEKDWLLQNDLIFVRGVGWMGV